MHCELEVKEYPVRQVWQVVLVLQAAHPWILQVRQNLELALGWYPGEQVAQV